MEPCRRGLALTRTHSTVTVLNVFAQESPVEWLKVIEGDACRAHHDLAGEHFDLVYSNSVIEHVGGHRRRIEFAEAVHALGEQHWVQTPYRYFPIEPHWVFPGLQFLPLRTRIAVMMNWPLIPDHPRTYAEAVRRSQGSELLSRTHMRYYFEGSRLQEERLFGLIKSLIAVS